MYDGATTNDTLIGQWSTRPPPVISSSNGSLLVFFLSDGESPSYGFTASYYVGMFSIFFFFSSSYLSQDACVDSLVTPVFSLDGTITEPPSNTPKTCKWTIAPSGSSPYTILMFDQTNLTLSSYLQV